MSNGPCIERLLIYIDRILRAKIEPKYTWHMKVGTYIHLVLENAIKNNSLDFEESKIQFLEN